MAKLEFKLTKDQHEKLDESLKQFYVATQDGNFELEGVGSIQRALEAEKAARNTTKAELATELEELRKFKADADNAKAQAEQADLEAKGKYDEAQKARDVEWQKRLDTATADRDSLFADIKRERLTNELVKRGVLPDRAAYLVGQLEPQMELAKGENGYTLKKKGGIGDEAEFNGIIEAARTATPFFFAASTASGSGASGSQQQGGSGKTITRAQYDANPAAYGSQLAKGELKITD